MILFPVKDQNCLHCFALSSYLPDRGKPGRSGKAKMKESTFKWGERLLVTVLFGVVGYVITVIFSPYRPVLGRVEDYLGRIGLMLLLGMAAYFARKFEKSLPYVPLLLGLLTLSVAVNLDYIFSVFFLKEVKVSDAVPSGWAAIKANESFVVVVVILLLTRLTGGSLGSIFVQKGRLKSGLLIGLALFVLAAVFSVPMSALFKAQSVSAAKLLAWAPWILIYVLANATLEELEFRGLFLRKLTPSLERSSRIS
jgi:membrane protease YdiL (CAAX protease family)